MTSYCDITNIAHQIQMTTIRDSMNPPLHKNFLRTPLMPKHENNTLQKKFYNQFKKGTFSVESAPGMGYTWPVNKKLGCMHYIMFT